MTAEQFLSQIFPRLEPEHLVVTSNKDIEYNCIAWAAGDDGRWWWPAQTIGGEQLGGHYWPEGVDLDPTLENFIDAYRTLGYEPCDTGDLEAGFEKVVLYARASGAPSHAARQLPDGNWTSKCGPLHDITHFSVEVVGGPPPNGYGDAAQYMRRAARADDDTSDNDNRAQSQAGMVTPSRREVARQ